MKRNVRRLGRAGATLLAAAAATAAIVAIGAVLFAPPATVMAQALLEREWQKAAGGRMAFEVASVRPSEERNLGRFPLSADDLYRPTGGLFTASVPLQTHIEFAYKLSQTPEQQQEWLSPLPKWVQTDLYAIQAKASTSTPTKDQMRLMVQSLLAERFKLQLHFETREVPVLALTLINPGRLGPGIRPHSEGPPCPTNQSDEQPFGFDPDVFPRQCAAINTAPPGMPPSAAKKVSLHNVLTAGRNITIEIMISSFARTAGRLIVDRTGLRGPVDFSLEWTPEPGAPFAFFDQEALANGVFDRMSFQQALKEQFGMKLEATRAPIPVLIVNHVERPSEN